MISDTHITTNALSTVEFFFDYTCPYCYKAFQTITDILPNFSAVQILWQPCEAHPRPSEHRPYSDLCIQAMFYASDNGVDLWRYHELVFSLIHDNSIDVEDIDILAQHLSQLLDSSSLVEALIGGDYLQALHSANRYAFEQSGVWAVPALRANGNKLDATIDIGLTTEQMEDFLSNN